MERKLTAILAADVVSYGRLMCEDEAGTLAALKAHRAQFIDPTIAEHHGRIVKLKGDGALVEFASVVEALTCSVALQRGMAGRNADVPADRRIEFRIGIDLGDIIVDGDDIYGNGVNVAARLEAMRLNPYYPAWFVSALGFAYMLTGDYPNAIAAHEQLVERESLLNFGYPRLAGFHAMQGDDEKAKFYAAELLKLYPDFRIQDWAKGLPYKHPEDLEMEMELSMLRKAGLPE